MKPKDPNLCRFVFCRKRWTNRITGHSWKEYFCDEHTEPYRPNINPYAKAEGRIEHVIITARAK